MIRHVQHSGFFIKLQGLKMHDVISFVLFGVHETLKTFNSSLVLYYYYYYCYYLFNLFLKRFNMKSL